MFNKKRESSEFITRLNEAYNKEKEKHMLTFEDIDKNVGNQIYKEREAMQCGICCGLLIAQKIYRELYGSEE